MEIKQEIYIIISIFFLLALFLVVFFIYPLSTEIAQSSSEMILQVNSRIILKNQYDQAGGFKQEYESYQPNLDKVDSLFIDSKNPVDFIEFLEKTASGYGLEIQVSAPTISKEGALSYDSFQLSIVGGFSETLKFTRELESRPYLIRVQNMGVTSNIENDISNGKTSQIKKIKADILIKVLTK